jgi:hypothetical protein
LPRKANIGIHWTQITADTKILNFFSIALLAKVRNLPFDRLRVNGLRLKLFSFSVRGELVEPQKNTFARASKG